MSALLTAVVKPSVAVDAIPPLPASTLTSSASREESLVVDERSRVRPAVAVESKLTRMLKEASMPASRLQMRSLLKAR